MLQIELANTELVVSRLGFGTASLHHLYRVSDRISMLEKAFDVGFTHFDTAPMYGEGQAERTIGNFLVDTGARQKITLATKIGLPARPIMQAIPLAMLADKAFNTALSRFGIGGRGKRVRNLSENSCEESLSRSLAALKTDYIDLLMVHEPQRAEISKIAELAEWLNTQKSVGRVRYIGLAGRAVDCITLAKQLPGLFDILQVEDSLDLDEAAAVSGAGWPLQITYGYLRHSLEESTHNSARHPLDSVRAALAKNNNGMVLVSTRKKSRVEELAALVDEVDGR